MESNSGLIKKFLESMVNVGSQIASRKYIIFILKNLLNEKKERSLFIQYIDIGEGGISVDQKIDSMDKTMLIEPLNSIYDYLFFNTSKELLKETVDKSTFNAFKSFGLHV